MNEIQKKLRKLKVEDLVRVVINARSKKMQIKAFRFLIYNHDVKTKCLKLVAMYSSTVHLQLIALKVLLKHQDVNVGDLRDIAKSGSGSVALKAFEALSVHTEVKDQDFRSVAEYAKRGVVASKAVTSLSIRYPDIEMDTFKCIAMSAKAESARVEAIEVVANRPETTPEDLIHISYSIDGKWNKGAHEKLYSSLLRHPDLTARNLEHIEEYCKIGYIAHQARNLISEPTESEVLAEELC